MTEKYSLDVRKVGGRSYRPWGVSSQVYERLSSALLPYVDLQHEKIHISGTSDNSKDLHLVLDALQREGVDVFDAKTVKEPPFLMSRDRCYTPRELAECDYLIPHVIKVLGEATDDYLLDEWGVPHIKASVRPYNAVVGALLNERGPVIVVRRVIKELLENSELKGLKFVEPVLKGRRKVEGDEKVWVLWSDVVLPEMKNILYDERGNRFRWHQRPQPTHGCQFTEGYAFQPEPHYRCHEIDRLGDFDIAITCERFGFALRGSPQPEVIISQKLAKILFRELKSEISGTPVRIDEDDHIPWVGPFPPPWEHLNRRPEWMKQFE